MSSAGVADPRGDVKGSAWRQPVYKENDEMSLGADVGSGGADGDVLQQDNLRSRGALRVYGCMFAAASSALTGEERASGKEWNRTRQALDRWSGTAVFKVGGRSPQGVLGGTGGAKSWREYKKIIKSVNNRMRFIYPYYAKTWFTVFCCWSLFHLQI